MLAGLKLLSTKQAEMKSISTKQAEILAGLKALSTGPKRIRVSVCFSWDREQ